MWKSGSYEKTLRGVFIHVTCVLEIGQAIM